MNPIYPFSSLVEAGLSKLIISFAIASLFFMRINPSIKETNKVVRTAAQEWVAVYSSMGIQFPKVAFAQSILETGWFEKQKSHAPTFSNGKVVTKGSNNQFGMKINSRPYGVSSKDYCPDWCHDCVHACYLNKFDSIKDYAEWQAQRFRDTKRYGRELPTTDEEYIEFLGNYVIYFGDEYGIYSYAEDPDYKEKITNILLISISRHYGDI